MSKLSLIGTMMGLVLIVALPRLPVAVTAQVLAPTDSLAPVARLVGKWTGTSEGQPGDGRVERQYERVLMTAVSILCRLDRAKCGSVASANKQLTPAIGRTDSHGPWRTSMSWLGRVGGHRPAEWPRRSHASIAVAAGCGAGS